MSMHGASCIFKRRTLCVVCLSDLRHRYRRRVQSRSAALRAQGVYYARSNVAEIKRGGDNDRYDKESCIESKCADRRSYDDQERRRHEDVDFETKPKDRADEETKCRKGNHGFTDEFRAAGARVRTE